VNQPQVSTTFDTQYNGSLGQIAVKVAGGVLDDKRKIAKKATTKRKNVAI